ncbi:MAG: uracil-DNA glycosylase family protein [Pyrinomonadaceae bacterium]
MQPALFTGTPEESGETLDEIKRELIERAQKLYPNRVFVFGLGDEAANVFVVGESPGPHDIATGEPFTGPAGELLKRILASIGLRGSDCYLTNVVKFVSQGDELTPDDIKFFAPYLFREIEAVNPEIVITLGSTPTKALLNSKKPISQVRGEMQALNGRMVMPTFNPAYLLRDPTKKKKVWDDMKLVREFLARK